MVPHLEQAPAVPVPKALLVLLLRFVSSLLAVHVSHKEHFQQSELPLGFPLPIFFSFTSPPMSRRYSAAYVGTGIKGKSKPSSSRPAGNKEDIPTLMYSPFTEYSQPESMVKSNSPSQLES